MMPSGIIKMLKLLINLLQKIIYIILKLFKNNEDSALIVIDIFLVLIVFFTYASKIKNS